MPLWVVVVSRGSSNEIQGTFAQLPLPAEGTTFIWRGPSAGIAASARDASSKVWTIGWLPPNFSPVACRYSERMRCSAARNRSIGCRTPGSCVSIRPGGRRIAGAVNRCGRWDIRNYDACDADGG